MARNDDVTHGDRELGLESIDRDLLRTILRAHLPADARVFVFGSRARGRYRRGSDIDLAVDTGTELPFTTRAALSADLEDSLLPVTVDIVDVRGADAAFVRRIEPQFVPFPLD